MAGFSGDQLQGFDRVRQIADAGNPLMGQAQDYVSKALNGGQVYTPQANPYAGENPYLGQMIEDSQNEVARSYNNTVAPNLMAQFNAGGAYGGTAHQEALSGSQRQLADHLRQISTTARGDDYNRQVQMAENALNRDQQAWQMNRGQELAALGAVPGLSQSRYDDARALMNIGQQQQNLYQGLLDSDYENYMDWRNYPQQQLGVLANAISSLQGGGTSSSSSTGANPNYRSAGQNAAGYAALLASLWGD